MANGRTAAECYALGLDPTLATNDFRIVSIELVDVEPKVEWEPKVNRWTGAEIQAVLKGAATLEGQWEEVPDGGSSGGLAPPDGRDGARPSRFRRQDVGISAVLARWIQWWIRCF